MLKVIFYGLLCWIPLSVASPDPFSGNYWQCSTIDSENKSWTEQGAYELTATNRAFAKCKKESNYPTTCKTSKNNCEQYINGITTRPMWQCIALDQNAKRWPSNYYYQRDDAAIAAKAYCQDKSSLPETCYVNLITCRNMNPVTQ